MIIRLMGRQGEVITVEAMVELSEALYNRQSVHERIAREDAFIEQGIEPVLELVAEPTMNIRQQTYLSIVNGLCALGVSNESIRQQANEIYPSVIGRVEQLGDK
ncbi:MAG: hypothetical protein JKY62_16940 [Desulfocapsa sp.]|nr:hypothetical protein [Desulfocapsa sp.]